MLDLAPKRVEHGTDLVELTAALSATRTANIKQLLAKAAEITRAARRFSEVVDQEGAA